MSRSALRLAALASSAVPGLDPVSVEGVPVHLGAPYEFAFVTDAQDRHWVVKAARSAAAGALLDDVSTLMTLLARRLEVAVPLVRGVAVTKAGRAVVHPRVPGQSIDFAALPPGASLTADVGRALAHIHNLELPVFEEAGRPSYDAETHRKRMLSELDRASATGHVPTGLLARWEHRLEDVSLWRFAPTPVHGAFSGSHVLVSFEDEQDAGAGRVRGVIGWEQARVGDPADDLADLVSHTQPAALDTVLEAYVHSRVERPDTNLVRRARLAAEMAVVHDLLRALSAGEARLAEHLSAQLRELDERVQEAERRAEARRLRAERQARREREQAQAAAAMSSIEAVRPEDQATQGFAPVGAGSTDEATQPFAGPSAASADQLTQPFEPFAGVPADAATQPVGSAQPAHDQAGSPSSTGGSAADESGMETIEPAPALPGTEGAVASGRDASWQLSTAVDPEGLFEIDAVEPLPEETSPDSEQEGAFDDQHEGASDFVAVDGHPERDRPRGS